MKTIGVLDFGPKISGFIIVINNQVVLEEVLPIQKLEIKLKNYIKEYNIKHLYIGLPVDTLGNLTKQSRLVKNNIHKIRNSLCSYSYVNERYSTQKAKSILKFRLEKKPIDVLAARIIWRNIKEFSPIY